VVGPEGGFSEREVETMRRAGAALASLGSGILRTETAAIVGAALVLARYGRLG
jgi:16S rRNA (uracil1498-N3)-methyltransferase